jgi:DNA helicase IV
VTSSSIEAAGLVVADADTGAVETRLRADGVSFTRLGDVGDVDARVDLVPASLAKGLEFDHVVLLEPADLVAAEADEQTGLRRLYVCLTRAVSSLHVLHAKPLPPALVAG